MTETALTKTAPATFEELLARARNAMLHTEFQLAPSRPDGQAKTVVDRALLITCANSFLAFAWLVLAVVNRYPWHFLLALFHAFILGPYWWPRSQVEKLAALSEVETPAETLERLTPQDQETLLKYLLRELKYEREAVIGPNSRIRQLSAERAAKLAQAEAHYAELQRRSRERGERDGNAEQRERLERAAGRLAAALEKDRAQKQELDAYEARVEAFFSQCESKVRGMAGPISDMLLLNEVENYVEGIEADIAASKEAIVASYARLCDGVQRLHSYADLVSGRMVEADADRIKIAAKEDIEKLDKEISATLAALPSLPETPAFEKLA